MLFSFPQDVDPLTNARITLAPQWISTMDLESLEAILKKHRAFFATHSEALEEIEALLHAKKNWY